MCQNALILIISNPSCIYSRKNHNIQRCSTSPQLWCEEKKNLSSLSGLKNKTAMFSSLLAEGCSHLGCVVEWKTFDPRKPLRSWPVACSISDARIQSKAPPPTHSFIPNNIQYLSISVNLWLMKRFCGPGFATKSQPARSEAAGGLLVNERRLKTKWK